jgi:hypothetical protein
MEHAETILNFLSNRRDANGLIAPISNADLLRETNRTASGYAITYGQAISLLDIASLNANLPLIGQLVTFNRSNQFDGNWEIWEQFNTLLTCAPRIKSWSDADIINVRDCLSPRSPSLMWREMAEDSEIWLQRSIESAQIALQEYVNNQITNA